MLATVASFSSRTGVFALAYEPCCKLHSVYGFNRFGEFLKKSVSRFLIFFSRCLASPADARHFLDFKPMSTPTFRGKFSREIIRFRNGWKPEHLWPYMKKYGICTHQAHDLFFGSESPMKKIDVHFGGGMT